MLKAFCCATPENIAPLTVAVSSFLHHNPDVSVTVFAGLTTDVTPLEATGVEVKRFAAECLMLVALEYFLSIRGLDRVLHIGHTTLTQDRLDDIGEIEMGTLSLGVTGIWTFAASEEMMNWYFVENETLQNHRRSVNERYFDTEFLLFNIAYLRRRPRIYLTLDFFRGSFDSESDYLNALFKNDHYLVMPPNLNLATEPDVADYLPTRTLMRHRIEVGAARVARFPGEMTPWNPIDKFGRRTMQLPMAEYLEAVERVESLLPSDFVAVVRGNYDKCESYLGDLPWAMRDISELKSGR